MTRNIVLARLQPFLVPGSEIFNPEQSPGPFLLYRLPASLFFSDLESMMILSQNSWLHINNGNVLQNTHTVHEDLGMKNWVAFPRWRSTLRQGAETSAPVVGAAVSAAAVPTSPATTTPAEARQDQDTKAHGRPRKT